MNESTREIDPTIGPTNPNAELPSRRGTRPDARNSLVIFCLTLALYLLSSSGRPRVMDEHMVFFQTQSLSERGTLAGFPGPRPGNLVREGRQRRTPLRTLWPRTPL